MPFPNWRCAVSELRNQYSEPQVRYTTIIKGASVDESRDLRDRAVIGGNPAPEAEVTTDGKR